MINYWIFFNRLAILIYIISKEIISFYFIIWTTSSCSFLTSFPPDGCMQYFAILIAIREKPVLCMPCTVRTYEHHSIVRRITRPTVEEGQYSNIWLWFYRFRLHHGIPLFILQSYTKSTSYFLYCTLYCTVLVQLTTVLDAEVSLYSRLLHTLLQ